MADAGCMASAQPRNRPAAPAAAQPATPAHSPMPANPATLPAAVANIIRRDGVYHLLMRVQGQWLETGITARRLLEVTEIADREFAVVHVNAPLEGALSGEPGARDSASDAAPAEAS